MSTQTVALAISMLALAMSGGLFLSSRQAAWSMRYFERWFQMASLVLDHPDALLPLWCGAEQYRKFYGKTVPVDGEPRPEELVFAEMYIDFMLEVNRRGRVLAFLTGRFPGRVPLTNPRTLHLWDKYVRSIYPIRQQRVIERAIARGR